MKFETQQALRLVASGKVTPYRAAKLMGIALPTIYRAIKRERDRAGVTAGKGMGIGVHSAHRP